MNALPFLALVACSPFEALCSRADNCGHDLDRTIEGFALRDGDKLTLADGRQVTVRVIFGSRIQAFGDDVENTDGLCGLWSPDTSTITLAQAPRCGPLEATLLHELGHAYHAKHGVGVMAMGYAGPVTADDSAELFGKVMR